VKELVYGGGVGRITKEVWAKAEDHVLKIVISFKNGKEFLKLDIFIKLFFSFKGLKRNVVF
jgi:hypothetical protein